MSYLYKDERKINMKYLLFLMLISIGCTTGFYKYDKICQDYTLDEDSTSNGMRTKVIKGDTAVIEMRCRVKHPQPILSINECLDLSFDTEMIAMVRDNKNNEYILDLYVNNKLEAKSKESKPIPINRIDSNEQILDRRVSCPDYVVKSVK